MGPNAERLFVRRGRNKISSSPLVVDANDDGWPEFFVGGPVMSGLSWDGVPLPGWPRRGGRPFASSPAFGDISDDRRGNIVVGCDDGRVYAFNVDGEWRRGWPVATGSDVFSTPALADVDGDGRAEVVVGSDDGRVYTIRGDGTVSSVFEVPSRPYVSASPTILGNGQGRAADVAIGAWDGGLYLLGRGHGDGSRRLASADHVVWSSATAFDLTGIGRCLAFSSDLVYIVTAEGAPLPGWPRRTGSWMVSSPAVVELEPGTGPRIIIGANRLHVWDICGRLQPGWPQDCGDFLWASPLAFDLDGDGLREIVAASWDGRIYAFRPDGRPVDGFPLWAGGAVFATPAVAPLPTGGGVMVSAAWDGSARGWHLPNACFRDGDWLQFRGNPARTGRAAGPFVIEPSDPAPPESLPPHGTVERAIASSWREGRGLRRIEVQGSNLAFVRHCMVEYAVSGNRQMHLAPVVNANGRAVAIVQALRRPHRIRYHVSYVGEEGRITRWPETAEASFISVPLWARRRPREIQAAIKTDPGKRRLPSTDSGDSVG